MLLLFSPLQAAEWFTVDKEWIAKYRSMEAVFKYPIPEDKEIRYKDGQFIVPVVVYRHYEDMVKTWEQREAKK
jgi:hypothetical protein